MSVIEFYVRFLLFCYMNQSVEYWQPILLFYYFFYIGFIFLCWIMSCSWLIICCYSVPSQWIGYVCEGFTSVFFVSNQAYPFRQIQDTLINAFKICIFSSFTLNLIYSFCIGFSIKWAVIFKKTILWYFYE